MVVQRSRCNALLHVHVFFGNHQIHGDGPQVRLTITCSAGTRFSNLILVPPVTYSVVERRGRSTQQASCLGIDRPEKAWKNVVPRVK